MPNDTVPAAASGLPEALISQDTLRALPMRDLYRLASTLQGVADLLAYSELSHVVHGIVSRLVDAVDDVVTVADAREPTTPEEARFKSWLLAQQDAWVSTDLTTLALRASEGAMHELRLKAQQEVPE